MSYIKPESIAPAELVKVTVKRGPEAMKEAFKAASELRRAGYAVALDPGDKAAEWTVEVGTKAAAFQN